MESQGQYEDNYGILKMWFPVLQLDKLSLVSWAFSDRRLHSN